MTKRVLEIKSENCTGCRMCELACSSSKEGLFIPDHSRIKIISNGLEGWSRPVVCLQCEDAMCLKACSVGAIFKTETSQGDPLIAVNIEKCIGCHQCSVACPFGAIEFFKGLKAIKCDLCDGAPICVNFCFYKCLSFIELSDEDYQLRINKLKALTITACQKISKQELFKRRTDSSIVISQLTNVLKDKTKEG